MALVLQIPLLENTNPRLGSVLSTSGFGGTFSRTSGYSAISADSNFSTINFTPFTSSAGQILLWVKMPTTGSYDTIFKLGNMLQLSRDNQMGKDEFSLINLNTDTNTYSEASRISIKNQYTKTSFNLISIRWTPYYTYDTDTGVKDGEFIKFSLLLNNKTLYTKDVAGTQLQEDVASFSIREYPSKGYLFQDIRIYNNTIRQPEYNSLLALGPNHSAMYVFKDRISGEYKYYDHELNTWETIASTIDLESIIDFGSLDFNKIKDIPIDDLDNMSLEVFTVEDIDLNIDVNKTLITKATGLDLKGISHISSLKFTDTVDENKVSSFRVAILNLSTNDVMTVRNNRWVPINIKNVLEEGLTIEEFNKLAETNMLSPFVDKKRGIINFSLIITASNENEASSALEELNIKCDIEGSWVRVMNNPRIVFKHDEIDFYLVEPGEYKVNY